MRTTLISVLSPWLLLSAVAAAQTPASPGSPDASSSSSQTTAALPEAPKPRPIYRGSPSDSYLFNAGVFCGIGASTSSAATKPATGCGLGITFIPLPIFFEMGVMAPQANRSYLSGYISLDGNIPLAPARTKYLPMIIVGYSRLFETGHSVDYGVALALPRFTKQRDNTNSMRIELRDYWTFAYPTQHNVMLRVGWMSEVAD